MAKASIISYNLALHQLAVNQVLDPLIQQAVINTERAKYVPEKIKKAAYSDSYIAIKPGRYVISPCLAGKIITNLKLNPKDKVLEVGSGTGYLSAIIARLAIDITSLETDYDLFSIQEKVSRIDALLSPKAISQYPAQDSKFSAVIINGASTTIPKAVLPYLHINSRVLWFRIISPASNNGEKFLCEMTISIFDGENFSHRHIENIILYRLGEC